MSCVGGRRIGSWTQRWNSEAVTILSDPVYRGFGPTLAAEYLHKRHQITVSKETVRQWMMKARLWRAQAADREGAPMAAAAEPLGRVGAVGHQRPRLAGGTWGEIYLITMIDDATSQLCARFVRHDSSEENMRLLRATCEKHGRPLAFYTDKAGMFQMAEKTKRQEPRSGAGRRGDAADAD